jgi:hypothetical protein
LTKPVAMSETVPGERWTWRDLAREPFVQAIGMLLLLALGGVAALYLGWRGAARIPSYVPPQVPWLMSGGLAGLSVLGVALGAWSIHLSRRSDAEAQLDRSAISHELIELCEDLRTGRCELPAKPAPKRARSRPTRGSGKSRRR